MSFTHSWCVFRRHATALGVNEERMTEMEGGKIEAGREMALMHGVYSARNLDADGSLEFNNTQRPNTHTFPLVHLVLGKVFIRDVILIFSEWTACSEVIRLNQMTSPQAEAQIEREKERTRGGMGRQGE